MKMRVNQVQTEKCVYVCVHVFLLIVWTKLSGISQNHQKLLYCFAQKGWWWRFAFLHFWTLLLSYSVVGFLVIPRIKDSSSIHQSYNIIIRVTVFFMQGKNEHDLIDLRNINVTQHWMVQKLNEYITPSYRNMTMENKESIDFSTLLSSWELNTIRKENEPSRNHCGHKRICCDVPKLRN